MCNPALITVGAMAIGGVSSYLSSEAQGEQADATNAANAVSRDNAKKDLAFKYEQEQRGYIEDVETERSNAWDGWIAGIKDFSAGVALMGASGVQGVSTEAYLSSKVGDMARQQHKSSQALINREMDYLAGVNAHYMTTQGQLNNIIDVEGPSAFDQIFGLVTGAAMGAGTGAALGGAPMVGTGGLLSGAAAGGSAVAATSPNAANFADLPNLMINGPATL